jgi:hypothetical protein
VPEQEPQPQVTEKVTVRNNSRRSLLVKVPGRALHLQPGTSAEVPRTFLATGELAALLRAGTVLVEQPPAPAAAPADPAAPQPTPLSADLAVPKTPRQLKRPTT